MHKEKKQWFAWTLFVIAIYLIGCDIIRFHSAQYVLFESPAMTLFKIFSTAYHWTLEGTLFYYWWKWINLKP